MEPEKTASLNTKAHFDKGPKNSSNGSKQILYVFLHLMKTGGSTIRAHLEKHLSKEALLLTYSHGPEFRGPKSPEAPENRGHFKDMDHLKKYLQKLPNEQKAKLKAIHGHLAYYGMHEYFPDHEVRYVAFFRDPASQISSLYNFLFLSYQSLKQRGYDTAGMLEVNPGIRSVLDESGNTVLDFEDWMFSKHIPFNNMSRFIFKSGKKQCTIQAVKGALNRFYFLGVMETFDQDFRFLCSQLGIPSKYNSQNVAADRFKKLGIEKPTPKKAAFSNRYIQNQSFVDVRAYKHAIKLNHKFKIANSEFKQFLRQKDKPQSHTIVSEEPPKTSFTPQARQKFDDQKGLIFPLEASPTVSIIIPVHNQWQYTFDCCKSILQNTSDVSYEIIIADDASSDQTKQLHQFLQNVTHVRNEPALRFTKNVNHAAKHARGEFLFLLNNDTLVQPKWLSSIIDTFKQLPEAGMIGSKLIFPDNTLQEAGGIVWNDGSAWNYGRGDDPSKPEYNYLKPVDYISGAAICIRHYLWKSLGGFDENFAPAYYEDTDLAFQVRDAGYEVFLQPQSQIIHFEGISHGSDISQGLKQYQVKNQKTFFQKWKSVLKQNHLPPSKHLFLARDRSNHKPCVALLPKNFDENFIRVCRGLQKTLELNVKVLSPTPIGNAEIFLSNQIEVCQHPKQWLEKYGRYVDFVWLWEDVSKKEYQALSAKYPHIKFVRTPGDVQSKESRPGGKKFIIFSPPRCGSTSLRYALNHLIKGVLHEPFNKEGKFFFQKLMREEAINKHSGFRAVISFLRDNYNGFKHITGNLSQEKNYELLSLYPEKVVLLYRRNLLKQAVSFFISRHTQEWTRGKEKILQSTLPAFPIPEILEYIQKTQREHMQYKKYLNQHNIPYTEIFYEDLYDHARSETEIVHELKELIDFLEYPAIEPADLEKAVRRFFNPANKLNSKETYNIIPNIEEIRAHFECDEDLNYYKDSVPERVLFVDDFVPTPKKDSGSLRCFHLLRILSKRFEVDYVAVNAQKNQKHQHLERIGVSYVSPGEFLEFLTKTEKPPSTIIFARPESLRWFGKVKKYFPNAKYIYDTVDLHYLRMERNADIERDFFKKKQLKKQAQTMKTLEFGAFKDFDQIWVVSEHEKQLLEPKLPNQNIKIVSNIHAIPSKTAQYDTSKYFTFVGNFNHTPNIDGIEWFVKKVWPKILDRKPQAILKIAGSNMPPSIKNLKSPSIDVMGYLDDLEPLLLQTRVSIAPLRYGAGVKGKVGEALSYGIPTVTTSIGAEGFGFLGDEIFVADTDTDFAKACLTVFDSETLWNFTSLKGRSFIRSNYSFQGTQQRLYALMSSSATESGPQTRPPAMKLPTLSKKSKMKLGSRVLLSDIKLGFALLRREGIKEFIRRLYWYLKGKKLPHEIP